MQRNIALFRMLVAILALLVAAEASCLVFENGQPKVLPNGCLFCMGKKASHSVRKKFLIAENQIAICHANIFHKFDCQQGSNCTGNGECSVACG